MSTLGKGLLLKKNEQRSEEAFIDADWAVQLKIRGPHQITRQCFGGIWFLEKQEAISCSLQQHRG